MGKITLYIASSLDGFIADANGGVDWLPHDDADDYGYAEFYRQVDALAMGRRTYDQIRGFGEWPYPGKPSYVFTGQPPAGAALADTPPGVRFVQTGPAGFAATVAARYSGTVWLVGGANLADQFRREGLIDEYRIFVIPIILGRGVPLFDGAAPPTALRLDGAQTYGNGMVELRYGPAPAGL